MYCCAHKTATLTPIQHTVPYARYDLINDLKKCCKFLAFSLELQTIFSIIRTGFFTVATVLSMKLKATAKFSRNA